MITKQYKKIEATKPLSVERVRLELPISPLLNAARSQIMRPSIYIANVKRIFDKSKL